MKIITQQIYHSKGKKAQQDLTSILTKWNVGGKTPQTSQEFLNKMGPWINKQIDQEKELKEFLKSKGVKSLSEL